MDLDKLQNYIFSLFDKREYWNVKEIAEMCHQNQVRYCFFFAFGK